MSFFRRSHIIVLDYVLKVTELGNFGIQTHPDKTLHDLDFADDIVLLDSDKERANDHITCLKENAGYVGLNINFKKTNAWFLGRRWPQWRTSATLDL